VKAGSFAVVDTTVDVHLPMADEHIAKIRHKTNQDEDDASSHRRRPLPIRMQMLARPRIGW